jgi:hypothetical protein
MKTIKLLEKITFTPAGKTVTIKCKEELKKDDRVKIPSEYIGLLQSEKEFLKPKLTKDQIKFEESLVKKDRFYKVQQILDDRYVAIPEIIGNKSPRINKEIKAGTELEVHES